MEPSEFLQSVYESFDGARRRGLMYETIDDHPVDGKTVWIDGRETLAFVSCSYLGLETDRRMKDGVKAAVERYGTQFSTSRAWLSVAPYGPAEELLSRLFGGAAMLTPSTTMGHASVLMTIVEEKDAVLLDHQVHTSVQQGATYGRANGAIVEVVRHGDVARLEERIDALCRTRRRVYYCIDGVFSMFGDLPDHARIHRLMDRYENLWLYVDDAHGMSIEGQHGRGVHLTRFGHHPRLVMGTSLNKAFAASGGCFVFPTAGMRERVRLCSGPLVFSGPIQPPMLGAIVTSAAIHLSPEIETLQADVRARVARMNDLLEERGLPLLVRNDTTIFFLKMGPPRLGWRLARLLRDEESIYVGLATYPIVSMKRSGMRIAVTRHHTEADLVRLADALARQWPRALALEHLTREEVDDAFRDAVGTSQDRVRRLVATAMPEAESTPVPPDRQPFATLRPTKAPLTLEHVRSAAELDAAEWNARLGQRSTYGVSNLAMNEVTFHEGQSAPENAWRPHYFVVREEGRPVLMTWFTELLSKDDFLMREEVSAAAELRRRDDPYFLTSRVVMMGSLVSEGNHLWLDREGPWEQALQLVLDAVAKVQLDAKATAVVLRDLPTPDPELEHFLGAAGFVRTPVLPSHHLTLGDWSTPEEFLKRFGRKSRKSFAEDVIDRAPSFRVTTYGEGHETADDETVRRLYALYLNVKRRKLRLNTFDLPIDLLRAMLRTPGWEFLTLRLDPAAGGPADGAPVAFGACFRGPTEYTALLCGLDYDFMERRIYRQLLWQVLERARRTGAESVGLGMDADWEKRRLGSTPQALCAWLQVSDMFNGHVLQQLIEEVGFTRGADQKPRRDR